MQLPREPQTGDQLDASWGRQVVRCLRALVPRGGPGVFVREGANGTTFEVNVTASAPERIYPFKIVPGEADGTLRVVPDSRVLATLAPTQEEIAITGLDTDIDMTDKTALHLVGTIEEGEVTALEIEAAADEDSLTYVDDEQTEFRLPLALLIDPPEDTTEQLGFALGESWVSPRVFTHLRLMLLCANGQSALYPLPA